MFGNRDSKANETTDSSKSETRPVVVGVALTETEEVPIVAEAPPQQEPDTVVFDPKTVQKDIIKAKAKAETFKKNKIQQTN